MEIDWDALQQRSQQLIEIGDFAAARVLWQEVLTQHPGDAMVELSYVESHAGRYRLAMAWAQQAANALPATEGARLGLIRRLLTFNQIQQLHSLGRQLAGRDDASMTVLVECARALSLGNDFPGARACMDAAMARGPMDESAQALHAQLLVQAGAFQAAEALLEKLVAANPVNAQAWWSLARLRKATTGRNHVQALVTALRMGPHPPQQTALLARALHKEADDIGNHVLAWDALALMCRAKRRVDPYDAVAAQRLQQRLLRFHPKPMSSVNDRLAAALTPIFIVGMHRSGSTLLEQMLAANPQVRALGELADLPATLRYMADRHGRDVVTEEILEALSLHPPDDIGAHYLSSIAWRLDGSTIFTDKLPGNYQLIGLICTALPQARILHLVRDPMDVCFSNLREIFNGINAFSYEQETLARHYRDYRSLMMHWHATCPGRILDVPYRDLLLSPATTMRRISEFCGIDFLPAMCTPTSSQRPVSTASSVQVRERLHVRDEPAWKAYRQWLQPLIDGLHGMEDS